MFVVFFFREKDHYFCLHYRWDCFNNFCYYNIHSDFSVPKVCVWYLVLMAVTECISLQGRGRACTPGIHGEFLVDLEDKGQRL